ncbi:hypothetical protein COU57_03015 [Candidatus Pacearchaeota archaeon CG10_big_fil_rev_8_21_14_0_10_32_14]|nr:MAG: hypothetical protein COU57_03015 [Candidatus Pacearchaeota archaeon CG10_big_fil_rev_8_21_14_0_10_32_14]
MISVGLGVGVGVNSIFSVGVGVCVSVCRTECQFSFNEITYSGEASLIFSPYHVVVKAKASLESIL